MIIIISYCHITWQQNVHDRAYSWWEADTYLMVSRNPNPDITLTLNSSRRRRGRRIHSPRGPRAIYTFVHRGTSRFDLLLCGPYCMHHASWSTQCTKLYYGCAGGPPAICTLPYAPCYMAIWLYGCMARWLYGYMAVWLYGYMAVWMTSCAFTVNVTKMSC